MWVVDGSVVRPVELLHDQRSMEHIAHLHAAPHGLQAAPAGSCGAGMQRCGAALSQQLKLCSRARSMHCSQAAAAEEYAEITYDLLYEDDGQALMTLDDGQSLQQPQDARQREQAAAAVRGMARVLPAQDGQLHARRPLRQRVPASPCAPPSEELIGMQKQKWPFERALLHAYWVVSAAARSCGAEMQPWALRCAELSQPAAAAPDPSAPASRCAVAGLHADRGAPTMGSPGAPRVFTGPLHALLAGG